MIPFSLEVATKGVQDGNAGEGKVAGFYLFKLTSGERPSIYQFFENTPNLVIKPTPMLDAIFPRGHSAKLNTHAAHVFGHLAQIFPNLPLVILPPPKFRPPVTMLGLFMLCEQEVQGSTIAFM